MELATTATFMQKVQFYMKSLKGEFYTVNSDVHVENLTPNFRVKNASTILSKVRMRLIETKEMILRL